MFFSQTRKNTLLLSTRLIQSMSSPTRCFEDVLKNLGILSRRCDWILGALGIPSSCSLVRWRLPTENPNNSWFRPSQGFDCDECNKANENDFWGSREPEQMREDERSKKGGDRKKWKVDMAWHGWTDTWQKTSTTFDQRDHQRWLAPFQRWECVSSPLHGEGVVGVCWQIKDLPETLNFTFTMVCSISRIYMMILNWFVVVCNNPTGCNLICTSIVVSQLS